MTTIPLLLIYGGMTFHRYDDYLINLHQKSIDLNASFLSWKDARLDQQLAEICTIIRPQMPCRQNAQYIERSIRFERYLALIDGPIMLAGVSLGGIFLAQWLATNSTKKEIIATYLVCPPFDDTLPGEDLAGGFMLPEDLSLIVKNSPWTRFFFSDDDPIVPPSQAEKYRTHLPRATYYNYPSKNGHFRIETFPEFVSIVQKDYEKYTRGV